MSISVMKLCWPLKISPAAKSVLIMLADVSDEAGVCWPSITTICERTCLGRTAVHAAVKWLEKHQIISVDHGGGIGHPNRYTLTPSKFQPETSAPRTDKTSVSRTVRLVNDSSDELEMSASRTRNVRQAVTNPKEPSRTIKAATPSPIEASPHDTKARLFREWKALTDGGGGGFLNRVLRDHKPESAVLDAVARTLSEPRNDPKAFLLGCLRKGADDEFDPSLGMTHGEHRRMFDPKVKTPLDEYLQGRMTV